MKIVIDIEEAIYKECIPYKDTPIISNLANYNSEIIYAIANGTPLPEHHGRLIDISEYEKYFNTAITYDDGNHTHVVYTNIIPTIIEGSDSE